MNDLCAECGGKCCQGIIDVYYTDEIFNDPSLVKRVENDRFDAVMLTDENFRCIALKNGKCSIYEKRPQICREFKVGCSCCENFRNNRLNAHVCSICKVSDAMLKAKKAKHEKRIHKSNP
jgi:Fe-S-cluster containining protein